MWWHCSLILWDTHLSFKKLEMLSTMTGWDQNYRSDLSSIELEMGWLFQMRKQAHYYAFKFKTTGHRFHIVTQKAHITLFTQNFYRIWSFDHSSFHFYFVLKLNKIFSSEQLVETEKKYLFLSFGYIQAVNFKH